MTDFTNLATLVAQGQSLLDLVKGGHITQLEANNAAKLNEVDVALAAKIAQANTDIALATAPINDKLIRLQMTKNQELIISSGTVPDDLVLVAQVTCSLVSTISKDGGSRDLTQTNLLSEISADLVAQFADFDVRADGYYAENWNVIRLTWDFGVSFGGTATMGYLNSNQATQNDNETPMFNSTAAALVKLESGNVYGSYLGGAELGKWRLCNNNLVETDFGGYHNPIFNVNSQTGSILIALPVIVTGVIDHPRELFKNIEL